MFPEAFGKKVIAFLLDNTGTVAIVCFILAVLLFAIERAKK